MENEKPKPVCQKKKLDIGWGVCHSGPLVWEIRRRGEGAFVEDLVNLVGFDLRICCLCPCPFVGAVSSGFFAGSVPPGPPHQVRPVVSIILRRFCRVRPVTSVLCLSTGPCRKVRTARSVRGSLAPGPCHQVHEGVRGIRSVRRSVALGPCCPVRAGIRGVKSVLPGLCGGP